MRFAKGADSERVEICCVFFQVVRYMCTAAAAATVVIVVLAVIQSGLENGCWEWVRVHLMADAELCGVNIYAMPWDSNLMVVLLPRPSWGK